MRSFSTTIAVLDCVFKHARCSHRWLSYSVPMRLWIFGDTSWTNREIIEEVLRMTCPDVLLVNNPHEEEGAVGCALVIAKMLMAELAETMPAEPMLIDRLALTWTAATCPHLALGFTNNREDERSAFMQARAERAGVPCAVLFDNPLASVKAVSDWVTPAGSTQLVMDLRTVRQTLRGLWRASPETARSDVAAAGATVNAAIAQPSWATVTEAWTEVEKLLHAQPRIAPWLVNPGRLLGAWAQRIERAG